MNNLPSTPLPWQQDEWHRLSQLHAAGRLPHALMLAGPAGMGKAVFARALAQRLMCAAPQAGLACGSCRACQLHSAGTHPDFVWLAPEEEGKAIKVDQVRELSVHLAKTAQQGGVKVAVLTPCEAMNANAANAILKTLEEPAANTYLLLVSHTPSAVLATIRSRCQIRPLAVPSAAQVLPWLETQLREQGSPLAAAPLLRLARGAPLQALALAEGDGLAKREAQLKDWAALSLNAESAVAVAGRWYAGDNHALMTWYLAQLHQLLRFLTLRDPAELPDWPQELVARIGAINPAILHRYLEKVLLCKRQLLSGANPNKQLLWEELLLDWQVVLRAK